MNSALFLWRILPFIVVVFFIKSFLSYTFNIKFLDFYTGLALAFIPLFSPNIWSIFTFFLLGLLRSFEGYFPFFFFSLYYVFLAVLYHSYIRSFFKSEEFFTRLVFWVLAIIFLVVIEGLIFINRTILYELTFVFWLKFLFKSFIYALFLFVITLLYYKLNEGLVRSEE
ncbi:MAG: hypothetical protein ACK40E_02985 [Caldimicrobium sp.]